MKKKAMILMFLLILKAVAFLGGEEVIEEIIAVVNEDIITRSVYEEQHKLLYQMLRSQLEGEAFNTQYNMMKKSLLESMIREMLLLQEARGKGFDVTENLKITIENIKKENNMETDGQLKRELERQGIVFETWKKQMEEDLLKRMLIFSEVDRKIVIEDSEIVNYYKLHPEEFTEPPEYKLRAIYLSLDGRSEDELRLKREEISRKLSAGEEIAALAALYSEGPGKESQGDLGRFKKGELERILEQAVEKLNVGEVSPWLETKNGWYLLRLEEKKESRLKSFEEVKKDIENKLFMERKEKKIDEFLKKLKEKSYIKILNPNPLDF